MNHHSDAETGTVIKMNQLQISKSHLDHIKRRWHAFPSRIFSVLLKLQQTYFINLKTTVYNYQIGITLNIILILLLHLTLIFTFITMVESQKKLRARECFFSFLVYHCTILNLPKLPHFSFIHLTLTLRSYIYLTWHLKNTFIGVTSCSQVDSVRWNKSFELR